MGLTAEFDDRQTHIEAESTEYHPYEYQSENNSSWAGALPVKQCVTPCFPGLCLIAMSISSRRSDENQSR